MLGLLNVIRMENENLTFVALGTDLTTLGLNLNAAENLHETFMSPFVNNSQVQHKPEPLDPGTSACARTRTFPLIGLVSYSNSCVLVYFPCQFLHEEIDLMFWDTSRPHAP